MKRTHNYRECSKKKNWFHRSQYHSPLVLEERSEMLFDLLISLSMVQATLAASTLSWIAPGAIWYDTDGNKIDAHGGGVVKREDTFYWVGQSASGKISLLIPIITNLFLVSN